MEQVDDRPKWLLELENRKRKPRLAHETGAGAPCLNCNSRCPGLDLHFWRKICKNCKCRGDDHDVDVDEFPQFELLFGANSKNKRPKRSILLPINKENMSSGDETPFEWAPPNITKDLATDYMKSLPAEKLPIKGSAGAALRRQQLQKQLPLHDMDQKFSDTLSDQEKKQFEKYLDNLKNCVGQGIVSKFMTAKPFDQSLMTPANATDVQSLSPQHMNQLINSPAANLRTPSSFLSKGPTPFFKSHAANDLNYPITANIDKICPGQFQSQSEINPYQAQYHHTLKHAPDNTNIAESHLVEGTKQSPIIKSERNKNLDDLKSSNTQIQQVPLESYLEKVSDDADKNIAYSKMISSTEGYKNLPNSSINQNTIESPMQNRVGITSNSEHNSANNFHVNSPIGYSLQQVPLEACIEKISGNVDKNLVHSQTKESLANKILSDALLPPRKLYSNDIVGSTLDKNELAYIQEKLKNKYSNPESSKPEIARSRQLPIPNTVIISNDGSHDGIYENVTIRPRENISSTEVSQLPESINAKYHSCVPANSDLIHSTTLNNPIFPGNVILPSAADKLMNVEKISEQMEGTTLAASKLEKCYQCCEEIKCNDVIVTAEKIANAVWHPGCFVCSVCSELLVDLVYFCYKGKLYCGRDVAEHLEIPRCFACDELIFVREYTVAEGHNYHVKHFCCWDCDNPLAGQQYISEDDRPLCLVCYQTSYAKTCITCNQVIAAHQQGVSIKNLNFHAMNECFCCFLCKKGLLNSKMAIKEDKPFCSKECILKLIRIKSCI